LAYNLHRLDRLKYVMQRSQLKTLAGKYRLRTSGVYWRYRAVLHTGHGPRRGLQVTVERAGKRSVVAQWGGIALARKIRIGNLDDHPKQAWNSGRSEIVKRLLADTCEMCGSHDSVEVHHIRHLSDLHIAGRATPPAWVEQTGARQRKTLDVCRVCRVCHEGIHYHRRPSRRLRTT
jgi:hypothetical protein